MSGLRIHNSKISEISRKAKSSEVLSKHLIQLFQHESLIPSSWSFESDVKFPVRELLCLERVESVCCKVITTGTRAFPYFAWHRRRCKRVYHLVHQIRARQSFLQKSLFTFANSSWFSPLHNLLLVINFCFHFSLSVFHVSARLSVGKKKYWYALSPEWFTWSCLWKTLNQIALSWPVLVTAYATV